MGAHGWDRAEALAALGMTVPDEVTMIHFEPHRNIYMYQENYDDNTILDDPADHPLAAELWSHRKKIIAWARVHIANTASSQDSDNEEILDYTWDEATDTIFHQKHPDSDKLVAQRNVGVCKTKMIRVLIDIIDVLMAQGIVDPSQVPQDTKDRVAYMRNVIDTAEV
jgi:hypothetical protein